MSINGLTKVVIVAAGVALAAPIAMAAPSSQEMATLKNAPPLSEVVKKLEGQGYSRITEVDFEHGYYEVKGQQTDGKWFSVHVDPKTGDIEKGKMKHEGKAAPAPAATPAPATTPAPAATPPAHPAGSSNTTK